MAELPTGTVTFLYTDIEGSTRRWEHAPGAMHAALARHDALLRAAIEANGGVVFRTAGDAFSAAFPAAPPALAAALAAQRALAAEPWPPEVGALRVRMALHAGAPLVREGEYHGPHLNRVARLLATGHGGQTLLSGAAYELARDALPPGVALRDLGEHRLKDLERPERVYQLAAPDLPEDFPPLRALDARPHNLPVQPTPLVGREAEVAAVCALLRGPEVRLVTLIGPGGIGKTRVGLQVAAELLEEYADGAWFVNLAPLADPALVPAAIAQAVGVKEAGERTLLAALTEALRDRRQLLLLDNFEQVAEAAPVVAQLLATCPRLKVLATSRAALRLAGEHEYLIPPLGLPDPGQFTPPQQLSQYEAVRLFIERARAVQPDFAVTNESAPAIAEICARLDGLPLAIELAAARIRLLTPETMLARLGHRLQILTGGARDLPDRQRTLRAAIDWSYRLLDEDERLLFARLAAFAGAPSLEAIEAVCGAEGGGDGRPKSEGPGARGDEPADIAIPSPLDVLDGVEALVAESLLRREEADGEPRFGMLETIHEYARERLEERGEAEAIRRRHAEHYLALAEGAVGQRHGAERDRWLARLGREHDDLRAALRWALARRDVETAGRLTEALGWFWHSAGHTGEGRRSVAALLALGEAVPPAARADALHHAGMLADLQGDWAQARTHYAEALALADALGDHQRGTLLRAHLAGTEEAHEAVRAVARTLGDDLGLTLATLSQGRLLLLGGDAAGAGPLLEEALALARRQGDQGMTASALLHLGLAALEQGELTRAGARWREALQLAAATGHRVMVAYGLEVLGGLAATRGEAARAARLFGASEEAQAATGLVQPPEERALYERWVAAARRALGEAAFAEARAAGAALSPDEAVAYALEEPADA